VGGNCIRQQRGSRTDVTAIGDCDLSHNQSISRFAASNVCCRLPVNGITISYRSILTDTSAEAAYSHQTCMPFESSTTSTTIRWEEEGVTEQRQCHHDDGGISTQLCVERRQGLAHQRRRRLPVALFRAAAGAASAVSILRKLIIARRLLLIYTRIATLYPHNQYYSLSFSLVAASPPHQHLFSALISAHAVPQRRPSSKTKHV
jgi:hypothetical protein